jgi:hypothetical protein
MRRFLRPNFRRPFPDFFTPKAISWFAKSRSNWSIYVCATRASSISQFYRHFHAGSNSKDGCVKQVLGPQEARFSKFTPMKSLRTSRRGAGSAE